MKKAWIIAIVLLCAIAVGLLSYKREPRYAGKSYTDWFTQFYTSGHNGTYDPADREEALFALKKMGDKVYPLLIKEYFSKQKGTKFGKTVYNLTRLLNGNRRDFPPYITPEEIHEEASNAIRKMGPSAQTLLPLLSQDFGQGTNKYRFALFLLGCVGENRNQAVPFLAKALREPDAWTRNLALQSLSWLGEDADGSLPDLLELFEKSNEPDPRLITLLGNSGRAAKKAVPKLERLCAATNRWLIPEAVALYQIDRPNVTALNCMTNLVTVGPRDFEDMLWALGEAREIPTQIVQRLSRISGGTALTRAIAVLEKNAPHAAVDVLMSLLESEEPNTRLWAAGWLLRIDRNHPQARRFIIDHLNDPKRGIIWDEYAIQQLGETSSEAKEIISLLNFIAKENPDEKLQRAAKKSLKRIQIRDLMRKEGWKDNAPYQ